MQDKIIEDIKKQIADKQEFFQLTAQYCEVHKKEEPTDPPKKLHFGKYESTRLRSYPFYKPYSKIVNPG